MQVKKKIVIILMVMLFTSPLIQAGSSWTIYPPEANWVQGYWDNSAGSAAFKTDSIMMFEIARNAGGDLDEVYYVTDNTVNLNEVSFIRADWYRVSTCNGNATFGIDTVKATNAFDAVTRVTSDFSRTNSTLNVRNYYGSYYVKAGGDTTTSAFPGSVDLTFYNITLHNYSYSYPLNATSITDSTATLQGYLVNDSGMTNITCGFLLGNVSTNISNYEQNISASGTYTAGDTFTKSVSSLTPGEYYYVRSWSYDGHNYNYSENETYFISLPDAPSNFDIITRGASSIALSWTNSTVGENTNHSVLIHYGTSSPPGGATPSTWGTYGANESSLSYTTVSGLEGDTYYYFVAWTYVNDSGSPSHAAFSSSFATTYNTTVGGNYTIFVKYENESSSGNLPVDLSKWGQHKFVIHTSTFTGEVIFDDGIDYQTGSIDLLGYFGNNASGTFSVELNETLLWVDFYWNTSNDSYFRCTRSHVVLSGERNITFYIRTDLPVYGTAISKTVHSDSAPVLDPSNPVTISTTYDIDEIYGVYVYNISYYGTWVTIANDNYTSTINSVTVSADVLDANSTLVKVDYYTYEVTAGTGNIEDSLVQYTYTFKDPSTEYRNAADLDAYAEVYYYNDSAVKQIIHREFFSANDEIYPMLIYDKKYRIGVGLYSDSSKLIELVGLAPTGDDTTPEAIEIPFITTDYFTFFDVIDLDIGWLNTGSGLYVYYQDTLYGTNNVTFYVYNASNNDTLMYNETSTSDYKNFTYSDAEYNSSYTIVLVVNHTQWTTNQSTSFTLYGRISPITDITSLDDLLEKIFGRTPLQNFETGETVPWSYILVGIVSFILMMSFGYFNATLGMMSTGLWLAASPGFILGLPVTFTVVGVFLVSMSVIFALGAKK